jgi:hypothetical protein
LLGFFQGLDIETSLTPPSESCAGKAGPLRFAALPQTPETWEAERRAAVATDPALRMRSFLLDSVSRTGF